MVFQDPMSALTPHLRIETQLVETIRAHEQLAHEEARRRAQDMLGRVQIADSERVLRSFPHELSGGMRQRVMLAIALACGPQLLIADEPTTALDVTVQAQLLALLADLKKRFKLSVILVSHDLGVVARLAKRVLVMYAGRIVEAAPTRTLFSNPQHPYTQALLASLPSLSGPIAGQLNAIPGQPPQPGRLPSGCAFAPRCPEAFDLCPRSIPALIGTNRQVACHLFVE
jgi:oligopeptide/dipeptide ABC transporter ATP-binding protein